MRTADPHAPTKENILAAARKLMLQKGFNATSVDEICAEAGATKGSFFHFFKSKDELGKAVLERSVCGQMSAIASAPFQKLKDPKARLLGRIDATIAALDDPSMPRSCILGNFSQELAPTHSDFQSLCADWFTKAAEDFAQNVAAALPHVNAGRLADLYLAVIQGSLIMAKAKRDVSVAIENLRQFRSYVEGLLEVKR